MKARTPAVSRLLLLMLALGSLATIACSGATRGANPQEQVSFGIQMAKQGLWQEALFRFEKADRLDPKNPKILNNLAVAQEANGQFDEALATYREALAVSPGSRDLKENYARFVDFYQSYRPGASSGLPGLEDALDDAVGGGSDGGAQPKQPGGETGGRS